MEKKFLIREDVKQIVASALGEVAIFNDDIESCEVPRLGEYHKQLLRSSIAKSLATTGHGVSLSCTTIDSFKTFGEMIDYVHGEQGSALLPQAKIQLQPAKKQARMRNLLNLKPVRDLFPVILFALSTSIVVLAGCRNDSSSPYGTTSSSTLPSPSSSPNTVTIASMSFSPATMTVARNTTVTWKNDDGVRHTATSDASQWNTGDIAGGASGSITFATAGTFTYHCIHHSMMTGTIIVQ